MPARLLIKRPLSVALLWLKRLLGTFAFVAGLLAMHATPAFAAVHDTRPMPPHTICQGTPIPPGWVITNESANLDQCGGTIFVPHLLYSIARPTGPMDICGDSPLPSDVVVVVEHFAPFQCGASWLPHKIYSILPVEGRTDQITICGSSPIPPGFVVTGEYGLSDNPPGNTSALSTCPGTASLPFEFKAIQKTIVVPSGEQLWVCADSPIAGNYGLEWTAVSDQNCHFDNGNSKTLVPQS